MMTQTKYNAHPFHVELALMFSSVKAMGPPMSDTLVSIIALLFSLEEARIGSRTCLSCTRKPRRISPGKRASVRTSLAPVLEEMIRKKIIIRLANRYMLYPLIPGIFEVDTEERGA